MNQATLQLRIAANHPCLPGHFPGQPVVPGVLVLDALLGLIEAAHPGLRLLRMPQVKFAAPLLPEQTAGVELDYRGERMRFRVLRESEMVASGELVFDRELMQP